MLHGRVDTQVLREAEEETDSLHVEDLEVSQLLHKISKWGQVMVYCESHKARALAQGIMLRLGLELNKRDEY